MSQAHDRLKQFSLFGIGTFQHSVLSNIPYISLPAALSCELFALLLLLGMLFFQKYSFLVSYFQQRMKKVDHSTALNYVYFEPSLGQHSFFFHVVVHIKKAA